MNLPEVGGRRLQTSLVEFENSCLVRIAELQNAPNPDTRLIEVLCNAVRLAREQADMLKVPCDCRIFEDCEQCRIPSA